jgi:2,3-bisphosphoglycerate-independent phosphoglycerate mutase
MKYLILVGDGMGDFPVAELDGKTPLQAANIPTIDELCRKGQDKRFMRKAAQSTTQLQTIALTTVMK